MRAIHILLFTLFAMLVATHAAPAAAQAVTDEAAEQPLITGFVGMASQKVFPDLFAQSRGLVVEGLVSYGRDCSVDLYGLKDLHPSGAGDEVSLGASCRFDLGKTVRAEVWVARSQYRVGAGITDFTARLESGRWDVMLSYYQWDGQNQDGWSAQVGYTIPVAEAITLRPSIVYTAGFGEPAILATGFDLRWQVAKGVSLQATTYLPTIREERNDGRKMQLIFGIQYQF